MLVLQEVSKSCVALRHVLQLTATATPFKTAPVRLSPTPTRVGTREASLMGVCCVELHLHGIFLSVETFPGVEAFPRVSQSEGSDLA